MQRLRVICLLVAAPLCTTCTGAEDGIPSPPPREVRAILYEYGGYEHSCEGSFTRIDPAEGVRPVPAPYPVGAIVQWSGGAAGGLEMPVKVEIDYHSTNPEAIQSWVDVTALAGQWLNLDPDQVTESSADLHVYENIPADLTSNLSARVTFADGEVVATDPDEEQVIECYARNDGGMIPPTRSIQPSVWVRGAAMFERHLYLGGQRVDSAPMTVGLIIDGLVYHFDCRSRMKYEVDWGDGSGWVDISADYPGWNGDDSHGGGVMDGEVTAHTYTAPGEYVIRSRVTYWDGTVAEVDPDWGARIVVTPADS